MLASPRTRAAGVIALHNLALRIIRYCPEDVHLICTALQIKCYVPVHEMWRNSI
jgi:hypothetical protein